MSLAEWLTSFRELHQRAQKGPLSKADTIAYHAGRDELARALLAAQHLTLKPGETPRRALRVARALQADLDLTTRTDRVATIDLSAGGFSALLGKAPPANEPVKVSLRVPGGEPIVAQARAVEVKPGPGTVRVSFAFEDLSDALRERLEMLVFDSILAQLAR